MIILTRLGGHSLAVNPDLVERAESTPDTVITMVDGHKLVVAETVEEVVDLVRRWRASVAAAAYALAPQAADGGVGAAAHLAAGDVTTHAAVASSLARVLRMPQREE